MAYTRNQTEKFEIDYPFSRVWAAIPEVVKLLQWKVEDADEGLHRIRIKSKKGFFAYETTMIMDVSLVDAATTRMSIAAETPVTTITAVADYGRTQERIEQFVDTLVKYLQGQDNLAKEAKR